MSSTITALTSGGGLAMAGDTSGQLELKTNNGTTAVTIGTDQTATFAGNAVFANNNYTGFKNTSGSATCSIFQDTSNDFWMYNGGATNTRFYTNAAERMRIASNGVVKVNTTGTANSDAKMLVQGLDGVLDLYSASNGAGYYCITFRNNNANNGGVQGSITINSTTCQFNSPSDYRLKENIAPMTGALDKVKALKPSTFTWKSTGETGQGFIAHELQEIVPDCVTGQKDEVHADGSIDAQQVDTSFLVATLTAAIQELNAKVDAQAAEIQALKGVA